MRILVFFDLATETLENKREYRRFRRYLIKNGYIMLQESVYAKLALNKTVVDASIAGLRNNKPSQGDIQVLAITEKQFQRIEYILGERKTDIINTDERLVEI